jgi:HlyD family type I secretion membrane fusion protein
MKVIAAHWESPLKTARSAIIAGCIIVLFMFVGFGGWAATVYIASAAIGQGTIGVSLRRQTIQHLEGGIIGELRVREGSYVKAGDLLIRLDDTKLRANYDLYRNQYLIALGEKARLEAQRDDLPEITFPKELLAEGDKDKDPVVRSQTNIFTQLKAYMRGQELIKREQESQLLSEIDALQAQKTAEQQKLALVKEELAAVEDLYSKGLEKKPRLLSLQRASAEIEGNIGQYGGRIAKARQSISELRAQLIDIKNKVMNDTVTQLRDTDAKLSDATQRLRSAEDSLNRVDIRAPLDGYVVNLTYVTIGGVVEPGKSILELVPSDDLLLVETRFEPKDIDALRPGLPAEVTLLTFNRREFPTISGKLIMVSADALADKGAGADGPKSYYSGRVELDRNELERLPDVRLVPGMPVQVMVKVGERTPLAYLIDPLQRSMHRALRER